MVTKYHGWWYVGTPTLPQMKLLAVRDEDGFLKPVKNHTVALAMARKMIKGL